MSDIVARIRKCLALSRSPEEHEAELAWDTATRLLAAHRLTLAEVMAEAPLLTRDLLRTPEPWAQQLIGTAAEAAGVVVIATAVSWRLYATEEAALDAAQLLYGQLAARLPRMAASAWKLHVQALTDPQLGVYPSVLEPGADREWQDSWLLGVVHGLLKRTDRTVTAVAAVNAVALVQLTRPVEALRARVLREVPGVFTTRTQSGAVTIMRGGYTAGRAAAPTVRDV